MLRPRHCTFTQPDFRNTKHTMVGQKHNFATINLSSKLGKAISEVGNSCHCSQEWHWWVRNSVAIWITAVGDRSTKPSFRWGLPPQSGAEIEFKSLHLGATRHMPQIIPSRLQTEFKCGLIGWKKNKTILMPKKLLRWKQHEGKRIRAWSILSSDSCVCLLIALSNWND